MPRTRTSTASVYYREARGFYTVRFYDDQGKRREDGAYKNREDAEAAAAIIRQRIRQGLPGVRERVTIAELFAAWWDRYVTQGHVAETTVANYRTYARKVLAHLGDDDANRLTPTRVIDLSQQLEAEGVSAEVVNAMLNVLRSAYTQGRRWRLVEDSPMPDVPNRPVPPSAVVFPTREEVARLGITCPNVQERARLMIAAYCGLRPGEQLALKWRAITSGRLHVTQSRNFNGTYGPTKTKKPRYVPIPPSVLEAVNQWHAITLHGDPGDPIFTTPSGTAWLINNWRRDVWRDWRDSAGLPTFRWQHLRHYYAAEISATRKATLVQLSTWMGHSTIKTTLDRYAYLFDEDADAVMDALG